MAENPPAKSVARDVFLYLLMIIVLTFSSISLGTILFQLINLYLPDVAQVGYAAAARDVMRFPVAALVIMFPALFWVIRYLKRDMAANPEKGELKIRKWLIYLTLFVTGLVMLGDMVALVNGFLQGDLTTRFFLKVLVVLGIAGVVFYYFLKDLHGLASRGRRVVEWAMSIVVIISLVAGFWVAGSPASNRARNNDVTRVNDLQMLESQVISYWQAKQALPMTLNDLADGTIGGSVPPPTDPLTKASFEYSVTTSTSYQFCATFESTSDTAQAQTAPYYYGTSIQSWQHGVGHTCFTGKIDPQRYPPLKR
jgi:hypothetical protein